MGWFKRTFSKPDEPTLTISLAPLKNPLKTLSGNLPEIFLVSVSSVEIVARYRQILADTLLSAKNPSLLPMGPRSAGVLEIFPDLYDVPDLVEWLEVFFMTRTPPRGAGGVSFSIPPQTSSLSLASRGIGLS